MVLVYPMLPRLFLFLRLFPSVLRVCRVPSVSPRGAFASGVQVSGRSADGGRIEERELVRALFGTPKEHPPQGENVFSRRIFRVFDRKQTGTIDFEEFVTALAVFHPRVRAAPSAPTPQPTLPVPLPRGRRAPSPTIPCPPSRPR